MSLQIGSALRYGFDRLFERNGLLLVGLFVLAGLFAAVAGQTLSQVLFDWIVQQTWYQEAVAEVGEGPLLPESAGPFAVSDSPLVAGVLLTASVFVSEAIRVISDRTFVSDATETLYQPERNLGRATLFGFVAGLIAVVATGIGLVLLIVPGIFIALCLYFVRQEIAVFDKGPIAALEGSWALTKGHRLNLLGLAVVLEILSIIANRGTNIVFGSVSPVVATVVSTVIGAFLVAYASATVAGAYRQLLGMKRPDSEFALSSFGDPYGDIDEEWR
ncbi:hypothetical protein ACFPYI_15295 [Halomarina salina]|uniref:DUF7847 domain-containing protein n=1 Tax=Halomarina salina TaxID=1872699 RepID=A0ABD5RPW6_9EURY|nr:hypothetical protein [Halomarina salina]